MTTIRRLVNRRTRRASAAKATGVVLWQGPSWYDGSNIVAIATWKSLNGKTGNMVQIWILNADLSPTTAAKRGYDAASCGGCAFRPFIQRLARRPRASQALKALLRSKSCYVNLGKAPNGIFRAYKRGRYPLWNGDLSLFHGRSTRFGAYGDPAFLPVSLVAGIAAASKSHTGYTHQWRDIRSSWARRFFMASCDSAQDVADATDMAWRWFYAKPKDAPVPAGSVVCPASNEAGSRTQCIDCTLCDGVQYDLDRRKSITINAH